MFQESALADPAIATLGHSQSPKIACCQSALLTEANIASTGKWPEGAIMEQRGASRARANDLPASSPQQGLQGTEGR
jgi:hypothetical protein